MKKFIVDTNIFLRFLLNDNPVLAKKAEDYLKKAKEKEIKIFCPEIVIFELVFVLERVYRFPKKGIVEKIKALLVAPYIEVEKREVFLSALKYYLRKNIDFVNIFLFFLAKTKSFEVLSFDKDFKKLAS